MSGFTPRRERDRATPAQQLIAEADRSREQAVEAMLAGLPALTRHFRAREHLFARCAEAAGFLDAPGEP